jgi:hypothetical protein
MTGREEYNQNRISRLLPSLLHDKGWEKQVDLHSIFPKWQELVGEEISEHAQPLKIERGVLWLEVTNSSWLQQLQYEKIPLLEKLNLFLRLSSLKDIKMVLPRGKEKKAADENHGTDSAIEFVQPSKEKIVAFQRQVECIADVKCREALMQFWYLAQACKRKTE